MNCLVNNIFNFGMGGLLRKKGKQPLNISLDVNVLLITSYAQKTLAQAFKYSLDDRYPIQSKNEDDAYTPVRVYKNIRRDEKQDIEISVSICRRISVYNTEPYNDYFLDNIDYGFNYIVLLYNSSSISKEDYYMTILHLLKHKNVYNPSCIIAVDFNYISPSDEIFIPKCVSTIITKIPCDKANFADKLLDRIFNLDIITSDISVTEIPSTYVESVKRT